MDLKGVKIEFLGHSGFLFSDANGKKIAIDPLNVSDKVKDVDMILITHSHFDHCSIKDIEKIKKKGTTVVIPADAQSKITRISDVDMQIIEVGDELQLGDVKVEAIPAYNIKKDFHPKSEGWMGYLIKFDDVVIYHAGDTDKIPEMSKLTGYGKHGVEFVALLPISGTYVMDVDEAVEAASLINPNVVIPMHYDGGVIGTIEDAQKFRDLCKENGIRVEVLEKI